MLSETEVEKKALKASEKEPESNDEDSNSHPTLGVAPRSKRVHTDGNTSSSWNTEKMTLKCTLLGLDAYHDRHITLRAGGEISADTAGVLNMIDTYDRPGKAKTKKTYASAGTYAEAFKDEPGKRVPKAGVYAEAGVGKARAERSIFDAEAKGPNASAGLEASAVSFSAGAFARAEVASASATAGLLKAKVGLAVDTGVSVGLTNVDLKVLGTGFSIGQKTSVSLLGSELECCIS